jgi:CBS domain-containing protein
MLTDRDIVTRCLAANRQPASTQVRQVMTEQVTAVRPDMETGAAAHLMGRLQIRRLPVVENGKLCGMVSLGDMAVREETAIDAGDVLSDVSSNLSDR